jgi:hypothetical protein
MYADISKDTKKQYITGESQRRATIHLLEQLNLAP